MRLSLMSAQSESQVSQPNPDPNGTAAQSKPSLATQGSALSIAMTLPEAIAKLVTEPRFRRLVASFSGPRTEEVLHAADGARTEWEFQASLGKKLLDLLLENTATKVEHRVDTEFRKYPACLYISNHRDIVLDSALLNDVLILHDKPIPHVAIGDNLLQTEWMVPFYRLCRAFVIRRELTGKQLYEQSRVVSEFVRAAIARGEPVWMAQRPGRTKDGADKTEPGLLRMLLLAYERAAADECEPLYVAPVAVSYELEPCDTFKAATLLGADTKNASKNRARRDAANIMRGLVQPKGRICLTIRQPILVDNADNRSRGANRADVILELAQKVDQEIAAGYAIWPTNYVAHDLLHRQQTFADRYTAEERNAFSEYVNTRAAEILAAPADARNALLALYARPVRPFIPRVETAPLTPASA